MNNHPIRSSAPVPRCSVLQRTKAGLYILCRVRVMPPRYVALAHPMRNFLPTKEGLRRPDAPTGPKPNHLLAANTIVCFSPTSSLVP